jgi:hypothetical protein
MNYSERFKDNLDFYLEIMEITWEKLDKFDLDFISNVTKRELA